VSCFSAETTVGVNVGGSENRKGSPNMRVTKQGAQFTKDMETKNLRKSELALKVVIPFHVPSCPPLYGGEGTFTSREYPRI
jgi:hypothetical protein